MKITAIAIYVPEPSLGLASDFYAALLGAHSPTLQNGDEPHYLIASSTLTIEVHPATNCPHTTMRLEFSGDAESATKRLGDRLHTAFERTSDGGGWWTTDPGGNTVVLLKGHRNRGDATAMTRRFRRGDLVRISPDGKVYKVIRHTRDGRAYLSADADHPAAATRLPAADMAYNPDTLIPVTSDLQS